jgi:tripartite-type tricarboxylate transporter receptor subunit TctC
MLRRITAWIATALLAAPLAFTSFAVAAADAWPTRSVRIVVPFSPGGSNDLIARRLAQWLSTDMNQAFVVENRAGAGGAVGSNVVATSPPDGYTLLFVSGSLATSAAVQKVPYDPVEAFSPVGRVAAAPFVVITRNDFPAKTMPELIDYARANPGKINYGSAGLGDSTQLATELLSNIAKVKMTGINYKGIAPAQLDLAAGRIDIIITTMASVKGTVTDALPKIAFTSQQRDPEFPDIPTVKESTGLDYVVDVWWALFAPAGLPAAIQSHLNGRLAVALEQPEFKEFLKTAGATPAPSTPQQLQALVAQDVKRWTETAETAGLRQ